MGVMTTCFTTYVRTYLHLLLQRMMAISAIIPKLYSYRRVMVYCEEWCVGQVEHLSIQCNDSCSPSTQVHSVSKWISSQIPNLSHRGYESSCQIWYGNEMMNKLEMRMGITSETYGMYRVCFDFEFKFESLNWKCMNCAFLGQSTRDTVIED